MIPDSTQAGTFAIPWTRDFVEDLRQGSQKSSYLDPSEFRGAYGTGSEEASPAQPRRSSSKQQQDRPCWPHHSRRSAPSLTPRTNPVGSRRCMLPLNDQGLIEPEEAAPSRYFHVMVSNQYEGSRSSMSWQASGRWNRPTMEPSAVGTLHSGTTLQPVTIISRNLNSAALHFPDHDSSANQFLAPAESTLARELASRTHGAVLDEHASTARFFPQRASNVHRARQLLQQVMLEPRPIF